MPRLCYGPRAKNAETQMESVTNPQQASELPSPVIGKAPLLSGLHFFTRVILIGASRTVVTSSETEKKNCGDQKDFFTSQDEAIHLITTASLTVSVDQRNHKCHNRGSR